MIRAIENKEIGATVVALDSVLLQPPDGDRPFLCPRRRTASIRFDVRYRVTPR